MNKVIITWFYGHIKETSTLRFGMPLEYYEELVGAGIECFSEKHNVPKHLVNVDILLKYIRK